MSYVAVNLDRLDIVEENDSARHVRQQRETEALSDAWLWPTGYEESDFRG